MTDAVIETTSEGTGSSGGSSAPVVDVDAAMLAAARAASKAPAPTEDAAPSEGIEPAPEAGEATVDPTAVAAPAQVDEFDKFRSMLEKREQEQQQREATERRVAERLRAEMRAELEAERARIREEVKREAANEYRDRLKKAPVETIQEFGINGSELISDLAATATPEHALRRELAEIKAAYAKSLEPIQKELEELKGKYKRDEEMFQRVKEDTRVREFTSQVTAEKFPFASEIYADPSAMYGEAQKIASEYCDAKGLQGDERICPFPIVLAELESRAKRTAVAEAKRLEKLAKLLQQPAGVTASPAETRGASTPRSISAQDTSTRRSAPKPPATPEEEDAAMLKAVREAMGPKRPNRMG